MDRNFRSGPIGPTKPRGSDRNSRSGRIGPDRDGTENAGPDRDRTGTGKWKHYSLACANVLSQELTYEIYDCELSGYSQHAESCGWPTVNNSTDLASSPSFTNYQNWCKAANLHNQDPTTTYTRKLTCYANIDRFQRSTIQFGIVKLNLTRPVRSAAASCRYPTTTPISSLPKTVDWRSITLPVRDQGECGSCWAHTAIGLCEAYHKKVKKIDVALSIQTLTTCDETNLGCDGGNVDVAGDYIYSKSIDTEEYYPYTLGVKANQEFDNYCPGEFGEYVCPRIVKETFPMKNRAGNCTRLKQLLQYSPVGIYMYAEDDGFLQYSSGVFSSKTMQGTTDTSTDHAVIAVGYTVLNGVEVFIIQNSWGTEWGQNGYVYVKAAGNQLNICGDFFYYNVFKPSC